MSLEDWGDYLPPPTISNELKTFIENIIAWHKNKEMLYPIDVLNFMVESNLVFKDQINNMIKELDKKELDFKLPKKYIIDER